MVRRILDDARAFVAGEIDADTAVCSATVTMPISMITGVHAGGAVIESWHALITDAFVDGQRLRVSVVADTHDSGHLDDPRVVCTVAGSTYTYRTGYLAEAGAPSGAESGRDWFDGLTAALSSVLAAGGIHEATRHMSRLAPAGYIPL